MSTPEGLEASASTATRNPYLEANFAPVETETTTIDLPVRGQIPEELTGRLVRIGPNPLGSVDPKTYHPKSGSWVIARQGRIGRLGRDEHRTERSGGSPHG